MVDIETLKVTARKRAIGPKWGFEIAQPAKAQHGIGIEREIMRQLAPMKFKRADDERCGVIRRLFG